MHYIVLDLEWNQGTSDKKHNTSGLLFEVIEVGAVRMNESGTVVDRFSELVRPQVYQQLNYITKQVTRMDMKVLKQAGSFPEVFSRFQAFCGEDFLFCTWGSCDLDVLQSNLDYHGIENPYPNPLLYLDVQKLYAMQASLGKSCVSLENAVEQLEITHGDDFHRALQDAYYTACVFRTLRKDLVKRYFSVDYHRIPESREEEKHWKFDFSTYRKEVMRVFPSRNEAMRDRGICSVQCNVCRKNVPRKTKWFPVSGKCFLTLARCENHGWIQSKARLKQWEGDSCFVIKTTKVINEEKADLQMERYRACLARWQTPPGTKPGTKSGMKPGTKGEEQA